MRAPNRAYSRCFMQASRVSVSVTTRTASVKSGMRASPPADERAGEDSTVFCGGNVLPYERHTLLNGALCREFRVSGQPEIVVRVEEGILKLLRQVSPQRGRPGAGRAVDVEEWFHNDISLFV